MMSNVLESFYRFYAPLAQRILKTNLNAHSLDAAKVLQIYNPTKLAIHFPNERKHILKYRTLPLP